MDKTTKITKMTIQTQKTFNIMENIEVFFK